MLVIHQWFLYTVLALEVVPQTALIAVLSAVGGFLVWWSQLEPSVSCRPSCDTDGDDYRHIDEDDYSSALIALVLWYARPPRCNPCTQAATHARRLQPHARRLQPSCTQAATLMHAGCNPHARRLQPSCTQARCFAHFTSIFDGLIRCLVITLMAT